MNDALTLTLPEASGRWRFDLLTPLILRPRRALARIAAAEGPVWQAPIAILLLTGLVRTLVAGALRQAANLANGPGVPPPGFEYYTPEQQAQLMSAMAATSGPVFVYVLPALMTLLGVLVGWLLLSGVLHLGLTLVGGRGTSQQGRNIVAWSLLPFALRDGVRVAAMWATGQPLNYPGLSGFAPVGDGNLDVLLAALLTYVDIYLVWHLVLLLTGIRGSENLGRLKAWSVTLVTLLGLYLLRALPALLAAQLSGLTVIRPFF